MCGIYGIAGFREEGLLERMDALLTHRGPDGTGRHAAGSVAMGMRRLAIIDLETGRQPIYDERGDLAIVYNGEVYNYLELREELVGLGHRFHTKSDTEVVLHAFQEWGIACLGRLNGMFALAIHDARSDELWLARDRCGQKPLYWWAQDAGGERRLAFASEVKALMASRHIPAKLNTEALDPYLTLRYVPEPATMFEGISTLPAAHWLRRSADGSVTVRRWWDVQLMDPAAPDARTEEEFVDELEALFMDAVRLTLRSDVPVAAYLSSGVDSSLIAMAMRRFKSEVHTYCLGFESAIDETAGAADTARALGTRHQSVYCTAEDFARLPEVVWQMDRPVGDALILAFDRMARAVSQDFKVVLGGEGADEMFAGYGFHRVIPAVERLSRLGGRLDLGSAVAGIARRAPLGLLDRFSMFPAALGRQGRDQVADFLAHYRRRGLAGNAIALRSLWREPEREALYAPAWKGLAGESWYPRADEGGGSFLDRLLRLQYREWLQDWSLIRQDKNTMAHSLEIRLPFLDHRLIELAFRMPASLKVSLRESKVVERRVARRLLPAAAARRPKIPFYLPLDRYHRHPIVRELVADTLSPRRVAERGLFDPAAVAARVARMEGGEFLSHKQVMALVILELWQRRFVDAKPQIEAWPAPLQGLPVAGAPA